MISHTRLVAALGIALATSALVAAQEPIGPYERGHRAFKDRNYKDAATWFSQAASGKRLFEARYWEGRSWFALRKWTAAEQAFESAWRANKRSSTALVYLGRTRLALKKTRDAVQALRSAANLKPKEPTVLFWYGLALRREGRPQVALEPLRIAHAAAPKDVEIALQLGWASLESDRLSEAVSAFRTACKLRPDSARNAKWLGIARVQAGQPRRAREALRASLRFADQDAVTHYWMGRALLDLKDAATAVKAFQTALKLDARWRTRLWLAKAQEAAGQRDAALAGLIEATRAEQVRGELLALLGRMQGRAGRSDLAAAVLRRAARRLPKDASVQLDLARATLALRQTAPAARALESAVALDPKSIEAWRLLGALRFEGQTQTSLRAARDAMLRVIALGGGPVDRGLLGRTLLRTGEVKTALGHLAAGATASPDDGPLAVDLGVAQVLSGDAAQGARTLAAAGARRPKDARAHDYLGRALHALNRRAEATRSFQAALDLEQRPQPHRYLAEYALAKRDTKGARRHAERAVKLAPDDADCRTVAGRAAGAARDWPAAFLHFAQASDLQPRAGAAALTAGRAGVRAARHQRALDYLKRAADLGQDAVTVARWQGHAHLGLQAWPAAVACYRVVLKSNPKEHRLWRRLGDAYLGAQNPRDGVSAYDRAVQLKPGNATYHQRLVIALRRAKSPALADEKRRAWLKAAHPKLLDRSRTRDVRLEAARLVIAKGPPADLAGELHLLRAELLDARGDSTGAAHALRAADKATRWSYRCALRRGELATQLGKHTDAFEHFQAARQRAPNRPAPAVAAAHARLRQGRVRDALADLRRAVDQHPRSAAPALELIRLLALREEITPALKAITDLRPRLDAASVRELRSSADFAALWSEAGFREQVGAPLRARRPGSTFLSSGPVRIAGPGASAYSRAGQLVD